MKTTRCSSFFIIILAMFFSVALNATTDLEMYQHAKKNYITSVFKNDKEKELKYLKELISYGKKSNQDIAKYKNELHRLDINQKVKTEPKVPQANIQSIAQDNEFPKEKDIVIGGNKKNVYIANNSLIINFDNKISKEDIKFTKVKISDGYSYQIEVAGTINDFKQPKLSIDGVSLLEVNKKTDILYCVNITDNEDLKVYYAIQDKRLIVKVKNELVQKKEDLEKSEDSQKILKTNKSEALTQDDEDKYIPRDAHNKAKIIVIDAGHGGKDSGAIGSNNEYEKDVVLKTAHYLREGLQNLGYIVYLTRDDDTFIELKDRTKIANKKNADLFVSIHANAAPKGKTRDAKGIETYFLSPARSDRAKSVAALENKEDIAAMDNFASQDILLTLLNRGKTIASQKMAIDIQGHMLYQLRKVYGKDIIDNGVREAPFWVLVGAQMPAVLVEMGYISHPEESQRLMNSQYQQEVANGIVEGITAYFIHNR
ncbi:MAG: N-acetylmuramoyl-L-alanine amidase [Arcobacter sp.]|nr:N-acetylmuramoyl-L-alanine amidase [Arcobacter sp.]